MSVTIEVYTPSTDSNQVVSEALLESRTKEVVEWFLQVSPGVTVIPSEGYWKSLIPEKINIVRVFFSNVDILQKVLDYGKTLRVNWGQEAVLITANGIPYEIS